MLGMRVRFTKGWLDPAGSSAIFITGGRHDQKRGSSVCVRLTRSSYSLSEQQGVTSFRGGNDDVWMKEHGEWATRAKFKGNPSRWCDVNSSEKLNQTTAPRFRNRYNKFWLRRFYTPQVGLRVPIRTHYVNIQTLGRRARNPPPHTAPHSTTPHCTDAFCPTRTH